MWTLVVASLVLVTGLLALGQFVLRGYVLLSSREVLGGGFVPGGAAGAFFDTLPGILLSATISSGWIALVATTAAALSPVPFGERLGLVPSRLGLTGTFVAAVGGLAVNEAIDAALQLSSFGRGSHLEDLLSHLAGARGPGLVLAFATIGLLAATAEELFFRGYLQRRLIERIGPVAGMLVTAGVFAFVHWDTHHSVFAFGFGLYVGWITWRMGSLWPAIVTHAANNGASVLTLALGADNAHASNASLFVLLFVSVVVAALSIAWIDRRARLC